MSSLPSGYLLIDKPLEMSSFFALKQVQKKLTSLSGEKVKIGHAGTLDPLATGLLVCGINKGTKILSHLIAEKKTYTTKIFLGKFSTTDDEEGEKFDHEKILEFSPPNKEKIEKILEKYTGKIDQIPPKYSALKISGKRACDRVRKGEKIEMKPREIEIFSLKIRNYSFPFLELDVDCGSGTYIRSLARDIGDELGCGGYVSVLRRETVGNFSVKNAKKIEDIGVNDIFKFIPEIFSIPSVFLDEKKSEKFCHGLCVQDSGENAQDVIVFSKNNDMCLGIGKKLDNLLFPKKIISEYFYKK